MDWNRVVEGNAKRLRRILAALVAMAGLDAAFTSPLWGSEGRARQAARPGTVVRPAKRSWVDGSALVEARGLLRPARQRFI